MGHKIDVCIDDNLYESEKINIKGVASSCYCCGQHTHMNFENLNTLPFSPIKDDYYYVFICDNCEKDISVLKAMGVSDISYDLIWFIQEDLKKILINITTEKKDYTVKERYTVMFNLYNHYKKLGEDHE